MADCFLVVNDWTATDAILVSQLTQGMVRNVVRSIFFRLYEFWNTINVMQINEGVLVVHGVRSGRRVERERNVVATIIVTLEDHVLVHMRARFAVARIFVLWLPTRSILSWKVHLQ